MAYTETTTTTYGQRVKKSFGGIGSGILLFIVGTILLWWNEGRAVKTTKMLNEAAEDARHRAAEQARLHQLLDEQETACHRAASDLDSIRTELAALLQQGEARDRILKF